MPLSKLVKSGLRENNTRLDLACGLTEFPIEIFELADSLQILNLSNNRLKSLPAELSQFKKLRIAFFSNNNFEEFPLALAGCPSLSMVGFKNNQINRIHEEALSPTIRWLILTNNKMTQLPRSIGTLKSLQKLMLAGNQLQSLPDELANCKNLELIRLAENDLNELPEWLFTLPRLSWLAYAGNPFCEVAQLNRHTNGKKHPVVKRSLPMIAPSELEFGTILGQGASGVVYQGTWTQNRLSVDSSLAKPGKPKDVAIKLFKGSITSDGSPVDEMQACIAAGKHPNLMPVLGQLSQSIDGSEGLVFALMPQDFYVLGEPPSFESCTRDIYPDDATFSLPTILQIARGIASAAAHLHQKGIMHGDLYAHNILVNSAGANILSDFGAASFYNRTDSLLGEVLERIEVRAFGCLLEELLDRCSFPIDLSVSSDDNQVDQKDVLTYLRSLQQDCMNDDITLRPRFATVCEQLWS